MDITLRQSPVTDRPRIAESSLRITGMHCAACAGTVEQVLKRVVGVVDAQVSAASGYASVRWDAQRVRASAFVSALQEAGYGAVPDTAAEARLQRRDEARRMLWRVFVAVFCSMQVMMLATPAYVSAPGDLAPDLKQLLDVSAWLLSLPVVGFGAGPFFSGAWRSLRQRRIGTDVPVALGIAVAFAASSAAAFDPLGPLGGEVWFDSLTMFITFLLLGRGLEMRLRHRAAVALEGSFDRLPETAARLRGDGGVETIAVQALQPGDRVRVPAGQAFPADGLLLDGTTTADEALLTGESRPLAKAAGDALVAGSLNLQAPVVMRVERVGADTRYEAIVALMRQAQSQRPTLLASADRWAAPFLWTVLALAGLAALGWSVVDPTQALRVAVAVLIVTCPCALSLAAPSALLAAAGAMARRGVLLRRLDAIEGLARLQRLFIDKTGTLTEGRLSLAGIERLDRLGRQPAGTGTGTGTGTGAGASANASADLDASGASLAQALASGGATTDALELTDDVLMRRAASLAGWSTHPLSRALRAAVADDEPEASPWRDVQEQAGRGIQAQAEDGSIWRLGSAAWAGAQPAPERTGSAEVCLSRNGRPIARFRFDERLRADAAASLQALQDDGVQVTLLSGDAPARVQQLGAALGLQGSLGGLQPQDKLHALREAQSRGERVGMLGDGINDAPVLAQADVSLAMGEGASVARAQADGVLLSNNLADVVRARALARRTVRVVHQNLAWAAVYNAACVPLALAGWLPPWAAGLGMAASSLFVVSNSLRLAR